MSDVLTLSTALSIVAYLVVVVGTVAAVDYAAGRLREVRPAFGRYQPNVIKLKSTKTGETMYLALARQMSAQDAERLSQRVRNFIATGRSEDAGNAVSGEEQVPAKFVPKNVGTSQRVGTRPRHAKSRRKKT